MEKFSNVIREKFIAFTALLLIVVISFGMVSVSADNSTSQKVVPVATATASEENDSIEIALLVDISGSMNSSDPERLAIEAAQQFVFGCPMTTDMYIKIIPYNENVYSDFNSVNVRTEAGLTQYLNYIRNMTTKNEAVGRYTLSQSNGKNFFCWEGQTDIGSAMKVGENLLLNSTHNRKAMILFTDGRIDTGSEASNVESVKKAKSVRDSLEKAGIPRYCIGLNANNSVDYQFLGQISGSSDLDIKDVPKINNAEEISDAFQEIYTYLFENSVKDPVVDNIVVNPSVYTPHQFHIYGQAVKQAIVNLESGAPIHNVKVTAPSGKVVAEWDSNINVQTGNKDICYIKASVGKRMVSISMNAPEDGDWKIEVKGEDKTKVAIKKIYLYELEAKDDIKTEHIYVDDNLKYNASIYNFETGAHISSTGLYTGEDAAKAEAIVTDTKTESHRTFDGNLIASKNGYDFDVNFEVPGDYTIKTVISHSQFEVECEKSIKVVGPRLIVNFNPDAPVGKNNITINLVNGLDESKVVSIPAYLENEVGLVEVLEGENVVHSQEFTASDIASGTYTLDFRGDGVGNYKIKAILGSYDHKISTDDAPIEIKASKITVKKEISDIENSGLSADFKDKISLKGLFEDSDGDELTYKVTVADEKIASAEIEDDEIIIKTKDFGSTKVSIYATDGKGAELTLEVKVIAESMMPLVVGLVAGGVALIVIVVIVLIILNKRKIIRFEFKVRLEKSINGRYQAGIYTVFNLSKKKNTSPKMSLKVILSDDRYSCFEIRESSINAMDMAGIIDIACKDVYVTGSAFSKQIKVLIKGKEVAVYDNTPVTVNLPDGESLLTIGSLYDI